MENKLILVTGGMGFLGKNITDYLASKSVEFICPGRRDYNLMHENEVEDFLSKFKPDIIIHAAADAGGLGYNLKYPATILNNNLQMNLNVFKYAAKYKVEKLVAINSACVYPGYLDGTLSEKDIFSGKMHESVEAYGFAKRAMILAAKLYKKQYGLSSINLILTNLYGIYDKFNPEESHVVAALIERFHTAKLENKPFVEVWGSGNAVREFMFSQDCAEAVYYSMQKYDDVLPLNIGTGIGTSIKELAVLIKELTNFKGEIIWDASKPDGAPKKVLDVSNMKKELVWHSPTSLKQGLYKTIQWYIENKADTK